MKSMPLRNAVIFDIDDTLVDHSSALRAGAHAVAMAADLDDPIAFTMRWKAAHAELYPRYLRGDLDYEGMCRERVWACVNTALSAEAADNLFACYMGAYRTSWRLFDDVLSCLAALDEFRLGIISNGRSEEQRMKLKMLGIEHRFEIIVISEEAGVAKPDSRIFLAACSAFGLAPEAVTFVGDSHENDYSAARAAGLSAVWLNRLEGTLAGPTTDCIGSLASLPEVLAKRGSQTKQKAPLNG